MIPSEGKKAKLKITNLGIIRMRGKPRVTIGLGEPRTLTVRNWDGKWYATICVRYPKQALKRNCAHTQRAVGIDLGVRSLVATSDGDMLPAPKELASAMGALKQAQRELSRKKRGSQNRKKAQRKVARLHGKVARRRREFIHQLSCAMVFLYGLIGAEDLQIKNMTRSARGTREKPGRNVRQKAGLNRSILDAAFGELLRQLAYKAEEAGGRLVQVAPNGTSQRCSECGTLVPKMLAVRVHECPACGLVLDRDVNAARNILSLALSKAGREPSEVWRSGTTRSVEARNRLYAAA